MQPRRSASVFIPLHFLSLVGVLALVAGCRSQQSAQPRAVSADTWATVDGRSITRDEVEKAFRRTQDPAQMAPEEALTAKLSLLNEMIVQDILLARARDMKIEVPDAELETAYNEAKKNMPEDGFQQELKKRNLTVEDMREGLRRELVTKKLLEQEVVSKVNVTDQEVTDFYNTNRAQFTVPEEAYRLAQIIVTPQQEPQQTNRTGNDAATPQEAVAKVQMIMERLKGGTSFRELAADYSEDPQSAASGGDVGLVPVSALKQAPPPLRNAVIGKPAGTVNAVASGGAYTIVLVVGHEPAGARDLSTPGMRENITATIKGRKEQLLRTAYLTAARSEAKVENHLARRLVDSQGKVQ